MTPTVPDMFAHLDPLPPRRRRVMEPASVKLQAARVRFVDAKRVAVAFPDGRRLEDVMFEVHAALESLIDAEREARQG